MTATPGSELAILSAEVAALGRRLRLYTRMFAAAIAVGIGGGVLLAAAPLQSQAQRITAQEITIVDAAGRARGTWSGDKGILLTDSSIALTNVANARLLTLNTDKDEPTILFHDPKGGLRMWQEVAADGTTRVVMRDAQGGDRVTLGVDVQQVPNLSMNDTDKKRRLLVNVANGEPTVYMFDAQDRSRLYIDVAAAGMPRIGFKDDQNKQRMLLAVDQRIPYLSIFDSNDKRRLVVNGEGDGGGGLFMLDAAGKLRIEMSAREEAQRLRFLDGSGTVTGAFPR